MNVVDSSGWLEYFTEGSSANFLAPAIVNTAALVVPPLSLYKVVKRALQQGGENAALTAVAVMQQGEVVDLTGSLALSAATLSAAHKLPLADRVMYATTRAFDATLWTQDADFECLPHPRYRPSGLECVAVLTTTSPATLRRDDLRYQGARIELEAAVSGPGHLAADAVHPPCEHRTSAVSYGTRWNSRRRHRGLACVFERLRKAASCFRS